ncbi:hypothetical protein B9K09_15735 [Pseudomonas sp. M30-35]|nr:hypothetical protein B9K09_15735 [Pseudomonas sp. M30-35]
MLRQPVLRQPMLGQPVLGASKGCGNHARFRPQKRLNDWLPRAAHGAVFAPTIVHPLLALAD